MTEKRVAVITGAASGIGQALAIAYAKVGIRVVAGYFERDSYDPEVTLGLVAEHGGEAIAVGLDVGSTASVDACFKRAIEHYGRVDIAVANAGILRASAFETMSDAEWDQIINVDLTGVMRTFRAAAREMREGGALVAVSSFYGPSFGWSEHAHYCAAKAGIVGLTKALAIELAAKGIRCNTVIPGTIRTPQSLDKVNSIGEDGLAKVAEGIPMKRVGDAGEVADVIQQLTSDGSRYITGQSIVVDGGLTVHWPG